MKNPDVWHPSVAVEENAYNWIAPPVVRHARSAPQAAVPTLLDLFSGCGGFSVGFEAAGFAARVALDIHPPSLDTFADNHASSSTICGDIRRVPSGMVKEAFGPGHVSVVTAGVPCQGFSRSNRKRHDDDKRNFLFHEFIRIASDLKPDAVVLENVSGLATSKDGEFKRAIAAAIADLGYDVHVTMLNAADYGVPQKRERIFFVGLPKGAAWEWPVPRFGKGRVPHRTVGDAILGDLPPLGVAESAVAYIGPPKSELASHLRGEQERLLNHVAPDHPPETVERIGNTRPGKPMYPAFKQRIRLHPDMPSPTQICGGIRPQFQFGHPTQARGMTIRERARIQSFPDSYAFSGGIVQGRVQTGNAVPPMLAQAIAAQIRRVLVGEALEREEGSAAARQLDLFVAA